MVFPLILGTIGAIGMVHLSRKVSTKLDKARQTVGNLGHDADKTIRDVGHDAGKTIRDVGQDVGQTIRGIGQAATDALLITAYRINTNIDLLTRDLRGFLVAGSLALILYLDPPPILGAIVWFLFVSLCLDMFSRYFQQPKRARSTQNYTVITNNETSEGRETSFYYFSWVTESFD